MEQDTEPSSETGQDSTQRKKGSGVVRFLTNGLNRVIHGRRPDTYMFNRFGRTPSTISFVASWSITLAILFLVLPLLWRAGFWGGALSWVAYLVIHDIHVYGRHIIFRTLVRDRMRPWMGHRFGSWEEFSFWGLMTHPNDLDRLAKLPDDDPWVPDIENGAEVNENKKECAESPNG